MNEYGLLKAREPTVVATAGGLDTTADFDDYTIYDEGKLLTDHSRALYERYAMPLVVYRIGTLVEYQSMPIRLNTIWLIYQYCCITGYPTCFTVSFHNYSHSENIQCTSEENDIMLYLFLGQLNEYGILKDLREKGKEGEVGLDTAADFDDYTIYETGPPPDVQKEVSTGSPR